MTRIPFLLVDRTRARQFLLMASGRHLFTNLECFATNDAYWGRSSFENQHFAVTSLGPNFLFDSYARQSAGISLREMSKRASYLNGTRHRQKIRRTLKVVRVGSHSSRLCWQIHQAILASKRSLLRLPDYILRYAVWGQVDNYPRQWRSDLLDILTGLTRVHLGLPGSSMVDWGKSTALLTHVADLRGTQNDNCGEDCPGYGGAKHHHFLINVGRGFLGALEQFGDEQDGVREYKFPAVRGRKGNSLRTIGSQLVTIYLPAVLGDPTKYINLTYSQHRLLQALVNETTRDAKCVRTESNSAAITPGDSIPTTNGRRLLTSSLLESNERYVGFNGNGKRSGLGYLFCTPGGWLAKAGYVLTDVSGFLGDFQSLSCHLGLTGVGIDRVTQEMLSLEHMASLALSPAGQHRLHRIHFRAYSPADFVTRWNAFFAWRETVSPDPSELNGVGRIEQRFPVEGFSIREAARSIGVDHSFLAKTIRGAKPMPQALRYKLQNWLAEQNRPNHSPIIPQIKAFVSKKTTLLDLAKCHLELGWSVVPQSTGAKKPHVKWKAFQQQSPSVANWRTWFENWPDAGLAVVLGPVSDLLVVDVDGEEAHTALVARLGAEPIAPKVLSGSGKSFRYHLFFRCPNLPTRAKSTPWHPQLEFRGEGGIVVIPPSLHPSGNRYRWAPGQSIDDLTIPELPKAIVDAHQPVQRPIHYPLSRVVKVGRFAPSTERFLAGAFVEGPNWNDRLYRSACDLAARQIKLDDALPMLLAGAQPWDVGNGEMAKKTILSAYSKPRVPSRF